MGDREKSLGSVSSSSISSLNSTHLDSLYPCAVVSEAEDLDGGGGKVGFDFPVSQVFAFGSPLGQVLASRQLRKGKNCESQITHSDHASRLVGRIRTHTHKQTFFSTLIYIRAYDNSRTQDKIRSNIQPKPPISSQMLMYFSSIF